MLHLDPFLLCFVCISSLFQPPNNTRQNDQQYRQNYWTNNHHLKRHTSRPNPHDHFTVGNIFFPPTQLDNHLLLYFWFNKAVWFESNNTQLSYFVSIKSTIKSHQWPFRSEVPLFCSIFYQTTKTDFLTVFDELDGIHLLFFLRERCSDCFYTTSH